MRRIGFTGTRYGMTDAQKERVFMALGRAATVLAGSGPVYVHHGDCVGADAEFHDMCEARGFYITVHPGPIGEHSAGRIGNEHREPLGHMKRNRAIVAESDWMIATPCDETEQARGGTWATIRMARRANCPLALFLPSGKSIWERWPSKEVFHAAR